MGHDAELLAASKIGAAPISVLMQDEFSGFGGRIKNRTPDTVAPDIWHDTEWHTGDDGFITVQFYAASGGNLQGEIFRCDVGKADHKITGIALSTDASAFSDNTLLARVGDTSDNGFVADAVLLTVEHDNNLIIISERVAGSNIQTISATYNPPENTDFELVLDVSGAVATGTVGGTTSVQLTGLTDTTSTNMAMMVRGDGSSRKSLFKSIIVEG